MLLQRLPCLSFSSNFQIHPIASPFPVSFSTSVSIFSFALLPHLSTGSHLGFLFQKTFYSTIIVRKTTAFSHHLSLTSKIFGLCCLLSLPNFPVIKWWPLKSAFCFMLSLFHQTVLLKADDIPIYLSPPYCWKIQ